MRVSLRLRLVPLATVVIVHALIIGTMLSALQVGSSSARAIHEAQLESASETLTVQAFISICSHCDSAAASDAPLGLPTSFRPDLKPHNVFPFPKPQSGTKIAGYRPSAASRPGIAPVRCEVHIHQNAQGDVQAIDLGPCTENAAWQNALLRTIMQAAALATPSSATRPPELTLTLNTNRISADLLARVLSDPATRESQEIAEKIGTWRRQ
jgi:hypothetical protein